MWHTFNISLNEQTDHTHGEVCSPIYWYIQYIGTNSPQLCMCISTIEHYNWVGFSCCFRRLLLKNILQRVDIYISIHFLIRYSYQGLYKRLLHDMCIKWTPYVSLTLSFLDIYFWSVCQARDGRKKCLKKVECVRHRQFLLSNLSHGVMSIL